MSRTLFEKIIAREIPADIVFEDDAVLAFRDIHPQAPIHVLVIPKGKYISIADFGAQASPAEITGFFHAVSLVAKQVGAEENGYRLISNAGPDSHQEVPHFHVHILAGRKLGPLLTAP